MWLLAQVSVTFQWRERVIGCIEAQQRHVHVVHLAVDRRVVVVRLVAVVAKQARRETLVKVTDGPTLHDYSQTTSHHHSAISTSLVMTCKSLVMLLGL